ncbi:MAG: flagellar protein FlbD [Pseudonocardiales bacterium]|jgi:flagellar protein FlbD|nr:flagellar protein FlbD [Pseudonocardiales bacterium]
MDPLILLRRLSGPIFALNPDLIERAEATPDTVLTMVNGNKYLICETLVELTELIRDHRARIIALAETMALDSSGVAQTAASHGNTPRLQDVSNPPSPVTSIRSREA